MQSNESGKSFFKPSKLSVAFATVFSISTISPVLADVVPPGFFLMPDGKMMAENPKTAVVPDGYHMRKNGVLLKIDLDDEPMPAATAMGGSTDGDTPAGFHKMPNGTLMANDPATATAPPGYHMMPDGTLMSNSGGGSHHGAGMWMLDYKFVRMRMEDMLDVRDRLTGEVAVNADGDYKYMMAPEYMDMNMHMGMVMYGFTNQFMGMLMVHYMSNSMGMVTFDGGRSVMESSGIADTVVSGMFQGPHNLNFTVGISFPTGSIDVEGPMVHGNGQAPQDQKYPYGMQLGSGSYEIHQGVDYADSAGKISWGVEYLLKARLNNNKHDYRLGNIFEIGTWAQWDAHSLASIKAMIDYRSTGQMTGFDEKIQEGGTTDPTSPFPFMSPSLQSTNYGGNQAFVGGSVKFNIPGDVYSITTDFSIPFYQNLWGPQMATSWIAGVNFGAMW